MEIMKDNMLKTFACAAYLRSCGVKVTVIVNDRGLADRELKRADIPLSLVA